MAANMESVDADQLPVVLTGAGIEGNNIPANDDFGPVLAEESVGVVGTDAGLSLPEEAVGVSEISDGFVENNLEDTNDQEPQMEVFVEGSDEQSIREIIGSKVKSWLNALGLPVILAVSALSVTPITDAEAGTKCSWSCKETIRRKACDNRGNRRNSSGFWKCVVSLRMQESINSSREFIPEARCTQKNTTSCMRLSNLYGKGMSWKCVLPRLLVGSSTINFASGFCKPDGFALACQKVGDGTLIDPKSAGNLVSGGETPISAVCSLVNNKVIKDISAKEGDVLLRQREKFRKQLIESQKRLWAAKVRIRSLLGAIARLNKDNVEKGKKINDLSVAKGNLEYVAKAHKVLMAQIARLNLQLADSEKKAASWEKSSGQWQKAAMKLAEEKSQVKSAPNTAQTQPEEMPLTTRKAVGGEVRLLGGGGLLFSPKGIEGIGGGELQLRINPLNWLALGINGGVTSGGNLGPDGYLGASITLQTPQEDGRGYAGLTLGAGLEIIKNEADKVMATYFAGGASAEIGFNINRYFKILAELGYRESGFRRSLRLNAGIGARF